MVGTSNQSVPVAWPLNYGNMPWTSLFSRNLESWIRGIIPKWPYVRLVKYYSLTRIMCLIHIQLSKHVSYHKSQDDFRVPFSKSPIANHVSCSTLPILVLPTGLKSIYLQVICYNLRTGSHGPFIYKLVPWFTY